MRKKSLHWTLVGSIAAVAGFAAVSGLAFVLGENAQAQNENKDLEIKILPDPKTTQFVFEIEHAKITKGQSITWIIPDNSGGTHNLAPKAPNDAFPPTGNFRRPVTKTIKFEKTGEIEYECTIHSSMQGKITVSEASK